MQGGGWSEQEGHHLNIYSTVVEALLFLFTNKILANVGIVGKENNFPLSC